MASQFTIYRSGDVSAPALSGTAGSLLALLDACLVTGYGTKLPPSPAWTKPFANAGNIGCYTPGAGAMQSLVVNDNGPGVGTFKEARLSGFETLTSVSTGNRVFPTAAQGIGFVVGRKSASADAVARQWIVCADSSTAYVFVLTGDTASTYYAFMFGDIYAAGGSADAYRTMLIGRTVENSAVGSSESLDAITTSAAGQNTGKFLSRSWSGSIISLPIAMTTVGDNPKSNSATALLGTVLMPNPMDNAIYLSPLWVAEGTFSTAAVGYIRGRLRGFYHFCHAVASVQDGQEFNGSGDYAGKSFLILKSSGNGGVYCLETSATVDTN